VSKRVKLYNDLSYFTSNILVLNHDFSCKEEKKSTNGISNSKFIKTNGSNQLTLVATQDESENEAYMLAKLRMSIFSILWLVNIIFLKEVMPILTLNGSQEAEQFDFSCKEEKKSTSGISNSKFVKTNGVDQLTLAATQDESENEAYMLTKLQMSIFNILWLVNIIFLEEVMPILTLNGSQEAEQFVTSKKATNTLYPSSHN
ncbi:hypothetical protein DVH24_003275, partial [Malus domestica]